MKLHIGNTGLITIHLEAATHRLTPEEAADVASRLAVEERAPTRVAALGLAAHVGHSLRRANGMEVRP